MATDTAGRFSPHMRGVTVTSLAAVMGVAAALVSQAVTGGTATDPTGGYVLVGAILVQFPILKAVGIEIEDFSGKDYAYVGFMTFALWFVCWAILLTAGVAL